MKIKHTEVVERKKEVIDKIVCDWCGKDVEYCWDGDYKNGPFGKEIGDMDYTFELEVELSGSSYGDWLSTRGFHVEDLCPECAIKLKGALIELGITVKEIEY